MSSPTKYFRLALVDKKKGEIENIGTKVFENHNFEFYHGLSSNDLFINIIFRVIAHYNIEKAEEELINRGFAVVNTDGVPDDLLEQIPHLTCNKYQEELDQFSNDEDALNFLNKHLPLMIDSLVLYLKRK